jgi:hypothetical protein
VLALRSVELMAHEVMSDAIRNGWKINATA